MPCAREHRQGLQQAIRSRSSMPSPPGCATSCWYQARTGRVLQAETAGSLAGGTASFSSTGQSSASEKSTGACLAFCELCTTVRLNPAACGDGEDAVGQESGGIHYCFVFISWPLNPDHRAHGRWVLKRSDHLRQWRRRFAWIEAFRSKT